MPNSTIIISFSSSICCCILLIIAVIFYYWFFMKKKAFYYTLKGDPKQIVIDLKEVTLEKDLILTGDIDQIYFNTTKIPNNQKYLVSLENDTTGETDNKLLTKNKEYNDIYDNNKKKKEFYIDFLDHDNYKIQKEIKIFRII